VERRRTCWAYSPGGHLAELSRATEGIAFPDCFHLTYDCGRTEAQAGTRHYHVCHPRRSLWRTLVNAAQTLLIMLRERPGVVISTGADVAVPALLFGKALGAEVIFIETGGTLAPSLSGRIVYPFADLFIIQWPEKRAAFPRAALTSGPLL
jgi:UDP-N-acetylglucosamine:LPS N-acetylglucosamine transferase